MTHRGVRRPEVSCGGQTGGQPYLPGGVRAPPHRAGEHPRDYGMGVSHPAGLHSMSYALDTCNVMLGTSA